MTLAATIRDRAANSIASLRIRNYRLYFAGQTISVGGTFMQTLAISFLALDLTGSGTQVGIAAAARLLPFLLLSPVGGLIADRLDKRKLLYLTQSASAVAALAFAICGWAGVMNYPLLIVLSLILGCLTVVDNPARQSFIADLVPRETLANAVILNSVSLNVARVVGSVVGGGLVALVGVPWCFLINSLSFVAVLVSLAMMRADRIATPARASREPGQIRAGFRYVASTPTLAIPLLMITVTGTLAYEFPTSLPLLATDAFRGDASTYGAMAAVMAGGSIVGGLIAASRTGLTRPTALAISAIGWGAVIVWAAIAPSFWLELVALAFVGYGSITFNSSAKTTLQLTARPEMRGRVMALWSLAWGGSTVIGGPLVGWIAEEWGSRWGLVVGGVPTLLIGLVMLPTLRRRSAGTVESQPDGPAVEEPV